MASVAGCHGKDLVSCLVIPKSLLKFGSTQGGDI